MLCTNSTDFLSIASRVEDQMALAVTASSLRGEFSTSGFVFSNSSPKRNSYKAKKHRSGQSKQSPGGGGGSVSGARGISPQVSTGESAGKTLGTGQTTSAGSTVVQPPPTLAPSRPALHNRRYQRKSQLKSEPNSKTNRRTRSRQPRSHTAVSNSNKSETEDCTSHPKESRRTSYSIDSGKGDELSSSCESTVFEPSQVPDSIAHNHRDIPTDCKRHSSCSDLEEDVFVDALSNIPSEASSVYTTPLSTRSQSPIQFLHESFLERTNSQLSCESSLETLHNSLQRIALTQQKVQRSLDEGVTSVGSCDSHVTSPVAEESNHLADHVAKPVTMATEFESSTPMCSTISERTPFFIGDIKLEMEENEADEGVDFEVSSPTKSDTDVNCGSLNPVKSASRTEIQHTVLTVDTQVQSSQPNYSSVSTASPMSSSTSASVCSHSSHPSSPRTLSPSPTPPCHKNEEEPQEDWNRVMDSCDDKLTHEPQETDDYRHKEEEGSPIKDTLLEQSCMKTENGSVNLAEQEDEWPDLTDFSQSTQKADLQVANEPHSESTPEWLPPAPSSSCHFGHLPPPDPQAAYPHPNFMMPPGESGFAPGCQTQTGYEFYSHPVRYWPGPTGFIPQPDQYTDPGPFPPNPLSTFQQQPFPVFPPHLAPPFPLHHAPPFSSHQPPPSFPPHPPPSFLPHPPPSFPPNPPPSMPPHPPPSFPPNPSPSISPHPPPSYSPHPSPSSSPNSATSFHPLQDTWVMWYDKITGSTRSQFADYKASLNHLSTVDCVEDFWRLYNNIRSPSELEKNANYHFFKENIQPLWEDQANKQGGKWVLTVKEDTYGEVLDKTWMELLMALVGEHMSKSHLVNGAVVSRRKKGDRIALWTSKKGKKANLDICKGFIKVLSLACQVEVTELPAFIQQLAENQNGLSLVYMHHTDSLRSGTSYQNDARISLREHVDTILEDLLR